MDNSDNKENSSNKRGDRSSSDKLLDKLIIFFLKLNENFSSFENLSENDKEIVKCIFGGQEKTAVDINTLKPFWYTIYPAFCSKLEQEMSKYIASECNDVQYFFQSYKDKISKLESYDLEKESLLKEKIKTVNAQRRDSSTVKKIIANLVAVALGKENSDIEVMDNRRADENLNGTHNSKLVLIKSTGKKYYVKNFHRFSDSEDKIDPREPFLYKVLEYIGLGPKATFLFSKKICSSTYSTALVNNFIMTEAVENFYQDGRIIRSGTMEQLNKEVWNKFKGDRKNLINFSYAAVIKGMLSMFDIFPDNPENYGIRADESDNYDFAIIDHLPGGNGPINSLSSEDEFKNYSPRTSIEILCKYKESYNGNLFGMKPNTEKDSQNNPIINKIIALEVNKMLFTKQTERMPIEEAIKKAENDIKALIKSNESYFIENSVNKLNDYIKLIYGNIEKYKKTKYHDDNKGEERGLQP